MGHHQNNTLNTAVYVLLCGMMIVLVRIANHMSEAETFRCLAVMAIIGYMLPTPSAGTPDRRS